MAVYRCSSCSTSFALTDIEEQGFLQKGQPLPTLCLMCRGREAALQKQLADMGLSQVPKGIDRAHKEHHE